MKNSARIALTLSTKPWAIAKRSAKALKQKESNMTTQHTMNQGGYDGGDIQEANARLIAAAPKLQKENEQLKVDLAWMTESRDHQNALKTKLLEALIWCEQVYGKDWPENASIRDTIKAAKGE